MTSTRMYVFTRIDVFTRIYVFLEVYVVIYEDVRVMRIQICVMIFGFMR